MTLISAYNSPGVTVTEATSPAVAAILSAPNAIAIVGLGQGYESAVDKVVTNGSVIWVLNNTGVLTSSVVVTNKTQNTTVDAGNYYVFQSSDPTTATGDEVYSIVPLYPSSTAPTVVASGVVSASLVGQYQYAYSYVTPSGVTGETDTGTVSASATLAANQGGYLTNVTVGPTGTTARNIYRAKVTNGTAGTFTLVGQIANNSTTTYGPDIVSDATAASAAQSKNGITSGDTINIAYNYADTNYYLPTAFDNFKDVTDKFGPVFASDGTISSQLSFAIRMAFMNGATEVIGLAYQAGNLSTALAHLFDIPNISFVSIASGSTSDHVTVQAHCTSAQTNYNLFRQCIIGQDSSAQTISAQTLRTSAQAFNDQNVILISPSSFNITNPVSLKNYAIGAQYAASAVAGMFAARDPIIPLTRKTVAGFTSPNETRSIGDLALDSSSGLFTIQWTGALFQVRHGITTAVGNVNTAECSVVRAKYVLAYELENSLQALIGMVAPLQEVPAIVESYVDTLLTQLQGTGLLSSYSGISARTLGSPTTVEVSFQYTPIYPINNILVVFTINTQDGNFALSQS